MPGLMAIIGADAEPMRRELAAVQRMANQAGAGIRSGLAGGGGHGGQSGIIRESIVMLREISAGNWTRVPGSFSILLQRLGVLNLILKNSSSASQVLADAWAQQSAAASLAAVAATRKAAASQAAFYADVEQTEATLAQAVADEEGAAAAILNAKATQTKAVASAEAAEAASVGATIGIGPLGIVAGVFVAIAAGAYIAYKQIQAVKNVMGGLGHAEFDPSYIAKNKQGSNYAAESQKETNREISRAIELYGSAAERAKRVADVTKQHFEHLRKMNEFEKDPAKKAANELAINQQERQYELANLINEKNNLALEGAGKAVKAKELSDGLTSEKHDEELVSKAHADAEEAKKYLAEQKENSIGNQLTNGAAAFGVGLANNGIAVVTAALSEKNKQAHERVQAEKDAKNQKDTNDEKRKERDRIAKESHEALAKSASIGASISDKTKAAEQAAQDEAEESSARLHGEQKFTHGHVNALQQVGAYAAPAVANIQQKQLHHLASIDKGITKLNSGTTSRGGTRPGF